MTSVIFGILVPFALFAVVLLCAIYRDHPFRAGMKIRFASFFFEATDPRASGVEKAADTPKRRDSISAQR
jgi:hypothetical protein